jgi:Mce-associated membrane protein
VNPTTTNKTATDGKKDGLASTAKDNGTGGADQDPIIRDPKKRKPAAAKAETERLTAPVAPQATRRSRPARAGAATPTQSAKAVRAPRQPKATGAPPEPTDAIDDVVDEMAPWTGDALTPDEIEAVYERSSAQAARRPAFRLPVVVAGLVIAILAASSVFFVLKVRHQDSVNSLRSSALTSASTYGGFLASYDYRNLTGPTSAWAQVDAHATASFKKDFTQTSGTLGRVLTQYNATAKGKVVAAGLSSVSGSRAVVLLFIDQTVTNTVQKPNSVTQPLRVQLTMLHQHGQWLIDNLQLPN